MTDQTDSRKKYTILQTINLPQVEKISELKEDDEGYKSFDLHWKDQKSSSVTLIQLNISEVLYNNLKERIGISSTKVFGVELDILVKRSDTVDGIPGIVKILTDHLRLERCRREGIFRVSGNTGQINSLKEKYNQGIYEDLFQVNYHVISNLFKIFQRELPVPLVTYSLYQPLLNIASQITDEASIAKTVPQIKKHLLTIPVTYLTVLHYVIIFLKDIASYSEITKMGVDNLSIVFASNIIRPEQETESGQFVLGKLESIIIIMINHVDDLFEKPKFESSDEEDENWLDKLKTFVLESIQHNLTPATLTTMSHPPFYPLKRSQSFPDILVTDEANNK